MSTKKIGRTLTKAQEKDQARIADLLATPQRTRDEDKELAKLTDPKDILEANGIQTGGTGYDPQPDGEEGDGEQLTNKAPKAQHESAKKTAEEIPTEPDKVELVEDKGDKSTTNSTKKSNDKTKG